MRSRERVSRSLLVQTAAAQKLESHSRFESIFPRCSSQRQRAPSDFGDSSRSRAENEESWPSKAADSGSSWIDPRRAFFFFSFAASPRLVLALPFNGSLLPISPRQSPQLLPAASSGAHRSRQRWLVVKSECKGGDEGDRRGGVTRF